MIIVVEHRCVWVFGGERREIAVFPTYFHSAGACSGLYTLGKSEYSTAAVEIKATEGVNAVLVEGKLP